MTGIELPSGEVEYIGGYMDAVDIIRRYVGDDLADYCREQFEAADYETVLAQEKAKTDEIAVMQENEELRNVLEDIQSTLDQLIEREFEQKQRINKQEVFLTLTDVLEMIQRSL